MNKKPKIDFSHETGQFRNHDEWITEDHMWSLWNDVGSADWTRGAFNQVINMLQKPIPLTKRTRAHSEIQQKRNKSKPTTAAERDSLRTQRDELLAACKAAVSKMREAGIGFCETELVSAIKHAEEGSYGLDH
jgi:hypothetical protein